MTLPSEIERKMLVQNPRHPKLIDRQYLNMHPSAKDYEAYDKLMEKYRRCQSVRVNFNTIKKSSQ